MAREREWYTHGVITPAPFKLSAIQRAKFLKVIGATHPKAEEFLAAVTEAISAARGVEWNREKVLPSAVRENIGSMLKATDNFVKSLRKLDQLSNWLTTEAGDSVSYPERLEAAELYLQHLRSAYEESQKLPRGGKLYQGHCRWLAYGIAAAMNDVLGIRPTLTHSGARMQRSDMYAQCLEIAIRAASFYKRDKDKLAPENLYYLMKEGLMTLEQREIDGGVTTFRKGSM
jgi:hypothetical protein